MLNSFNYFTATVDTIFVCVIGTFLAVVFSFILALPAAGKMGKSLKYIVRSLLNFFRVIPDLILAALMVLFFGLGLRAGIIALALHTTGVLGKLLADNLENESKSSHYHLFSIGASPFKVFLYQTVPHFKSQWIAYILYRLEYNTRMAMVIGVVGAGGLGQMLYVSLSLFQYQKAAVVILIISVLVFLSEKISQMARGNLNNNTNAALRF